MRINLQSQRLLDTCATLMAVGAEGDVNLAGIAMVLEKPTETLDYLAVKVAQQDSGKTVRLASPALFKHHPMRAIYMALCPAGWPEGTVEALSQDIILYCLAPYAHGFTKCTPATASEIVSNREKYERETRYRALARQGSKVAKDALVQLLDELYEHVKSFAETTHGDLVVDDFLQKTVEYGRSSFNLDKAATAYIMVGENFKQAMATALSR